MGNSCSCDNRPPEDAAQTQNLQTVNTPRNISKPEKLPSISHAVKSSLKKINSEKVQQEDNINGVINNNSGRVIIQNNNNSNHVNATNNRVPGNNNQGENSGRLNNREANNDIDNAKALIQDRRKELQKADTKVLVPDHVLKSNQVTNEQLIQQQLIQQQQQQLLHLQQQQQIQQQQQQIQQQQQPLLQQQQEIQKIQAAFQANQRLKDLEESKGERHIIGINNAVVNSNPNSKQNSNAVLYYQNQNNNINNSSHNQSRPQSGEHRTLFEKLGGEQGVKVFVEGTQKRAIQDPTLSKFFTNMDLELHQEKFRYYIGYLTGGHAHWIGQSLQNAHKTLKIDDTQFDAFVSHCVSTMKEMRVRQDCMREMVKSLQNLRDQIVSKPEDEASKNMLDRMGGPNAIKEITEKAMQKVLDCPKLKPYFDSTPINLHSKRMAYYIMSLIGGSEHEWIGRSLKQAHKGKDITEMHFELMIDYIQESALELRVAHEETICEFIDQLKNLQKEIVEENKSITLLEKIDSNDFFEPVMNRFIDKMMKDHILGRYFQNMKMKHMIPNKIMLFFAYSKGIMNPDDKQSIREYHTGLKITPEDFERSIIFFKESLYEFCIDPAIVEEAVSFYKTLRRQLAYYPEDHIEELQKEGQEYQMKSMRQGDDNSQLQERISNALIEKDQDNMDDMLNNMIKVNNTVPAKIQPLALNGLNIQPEKRDSDNRISSFRLESEQNPKNSDIASSSFIINKDNTVVDNQKIIHPPRDVVEELKVIEELENKLEESQIKEFKSIKKEIEPLMPSQSEVINSQQIQEEVAIHKSISLKNEELDNKDPIKGINQQTLDVNVENIVEEQQKVLSNNPSKQTIVQHKAPPQDTNRDRSRSKTPNRGDRKPAPQIAYKYFFYDLLSGDTVRTSDQKSIMQSQIYQGELNRFMEKQKSQLPRWLILNAKALMIYKDEMNSRSFPAKPLYCIPIQELKSVNMKEALLHPNQRKNQALHFLEIELKESYGVIAQSIAQLLTGKTIMMGGGYGRSDSPLKDTQKINKPKPVAHQNHSYDDEVLVFVSQSKKSIFEWGRRLKSVIKTENQGEINEIENQPQKQIFPIQNDTVDVQLRIQQTESNQLQEKDAIQDKIQFQFEIQNLEDQNQSKDLYSLIPNDQQKEGQQEFNSNQISQNDINNYVEPLKLQLEPYNLESNNQIQNQMPFIQQSDNIIIEQASQNDEPSLKKYDSKGSKEHLESQQDLIIIKKPTLKLSIGVLQDEKEFTKSLPIEEFLYDKLGGQILVQQLVDEIFVRIVRDPRLFPYLKDVQNEKSNFMNYFTFITGGSKDQIENPLQEANHDKQLKKIDFDKLAGYIVTSLQELNVSQDLINELIQILLPERDQFSD